MLIMSDLTSDRAILFPPYTEVLVGERGRGGITSRIEIAGVMACMHSFIHSFIHQYKSFEERGFPSDCSGT